MLASCARLVVLNLEPLEGAGADDFDEVDLGLADDLVPRWFAPRLRPPMREHDRAARRRSDRGHVSVAAR